MTPDTAPRADDSATPRADDSTTLSDGVCSDGELLWRAKPGSTSTFEELLAARELFQDLHADRYWNPWRFEAGQEALQQAMDTIEEWARAEHGFRQWTEDELDQWMAQRDADFERDQAERKRQREENRARYDTERTAARLDLLEHQHLLAGRRLDLSQMRSGEAFPLMDPGRRSTRVSELEEVVAKHEAEVERLAPVVGDPEDVVDQNGNLPRDRRVTSLYCYREHRITQVRDLQNKKAELHARLEATDDKAERSDLRSKLSPVQWHLDHLLAVPRLKAADMCPDCASPRHGHPAVKGPFNYPCAAWPGQITIHAEIMNLLESSRNRAKADQATPQSPKPKPLAVVPSGLPMAEIITRLQELQHQHPDAVVRRGRANRWELWPAPDAAGAE